VYRVYYSPLGTQFPSLLKAQEHAAHADAPKEKKRKPNPRGAAASVMAVAGAPPTMTVAAWHAIACRKCGSGDDDEDSILLCDGADCDSKYHLAGSEKCPKKVWAFASLAMSAKEPFCF